MSREGYQPFFDRSGNVPEKGKISRVFCLTIENGDSEFEGIGPIVSGVRVALTEGILKSDHFLTVDLLATLDESFGATVWTHPKTNTRSLLLATDGKTIVTSDPAFISQDIYKLGVGIVESRNTFADFSRISGRLKTVCAGGERPVNIHTPLVVIEDIATILKRPLNEGVVAQKRKYF